MQQAWRRAARVASIVAVWIVALFAVLVGLANTGAGQRAIARLIGTLSGGTVVVEGLSGRFPDSLRLAHVEIRDEEGPWLVIENMALDWAPLALVRNRLDVGALDAERVALLRLPGGGNQQSESSLTLDVRALQIEVLETGETVTGTPATVALQGAVRYASLQDWSADLNAVRLDAPGSYRVRASLVDGYLSGTADLEEPSAGLISGLLGFNDIGPITLHAAGSGPREANAIQYSLGAGPLQASGGGTINLPARTAALDFSASSPELSLRPDLSWQSLSAEGHLNGSLDNLDVAADADIRALLVRGARFDEVTANVNGRNGDVEFTASMTGVRVPGPEPDLFAQAPLIANGRVDLRMPSRPFTASLSHPLLSAEAEGDAGDQLRVSATVTVVDISPFAAWGGANLEGNASLTTDIREMGADIQVVTDGTIALTGGESLLEDLIGANGRFALNATFTGPNITVTRAQIDGAAATAQLSGSVSDGQIDMGGTLALSDLSLLTPDLMGNLRIESQARGPLQTARLQAMGTATISTSSFTNQQITFTASAVGLPSPQSGDFRAQGRFEDAPVILNGGVSRDDGNVLHVTVERGEWKSLSAQAEVMIPESGATTGQATVRMNELGDMASLVGASIAGALEANIGFDRLDGKTHANIRADARDLEIGGSMVQSLSGDIVLDVRNEETVAEISAQARELAVQDAVVSNVTISGRVADPFANLSLALMIDADRLTAGEFSGEASASLEGPPDAMGIRFAWQPQDSSGTPSRITGAARLDLPGGRIQFSALEATLRGETASSDQPFAVDYSRGLEITRVVFSIGQGRVSVGGQIVPRLTVNAEAENVPASFLVPFVPGLSPGGTLSATAAISGTLESPTGTIQIQGRDLAAQGVSPVIAPASLNATAMLQRRTISLEANLSAGPSVHLDVSGDVSLDPDPALDLDVRGTGDLSFLNPMLSAEGRSVRGRLTLNASVAGTASEPRMNGRANLSEGEIQDVGRGVRIRDIALAAEGDGDLIRITQFSGVAGDGRISGNGTINLADADVPVSLTFEAQGARPLVSDRFTATMDGTVRLAGSINRGLALAGTINVTRAEIILPDRYPPNVVVLDVRRPGAEEPSRATQAAAPMRLDLSIASRSGVFVRGRGIEAEVAGTVAVAGDTVNPAITGGFDLRRGTFSVAGQTLVFNSGRVGFDGTSVQNRIDPTLDLRAQTSSGGVTATLLVTGYASAPRVELTSMPPLPQDEILARVLFQRSAAQLSPVQLAQLAQTAVSLTSGESAFDPIGSLRRSLGLSRLTVGSTGAAGGNASQTTIEAGTYVAPNVFVGAKQTFGGGTQAEVQVDLTDNLKAIGTVNPGTSANVTQGSQTREGGSSVGLKYQFEY